MSPQVDELMARLNSLSDKELLALSTTPEWTLFMHKVYELRPGDELERIEMDSQACRQYPASTEYYQAQAELNRQRFRHAREGMSA